MNFTDLTVFLNAIQSQSVVMESNILKAVTHAFALCENLRVSIEGSCNGFFICTMTSVLHTIVVSLHGLLGRKHRTHFTREQKATSVDLATGKAIGTSVVNKASCISEQIRQTHLGLFCFSMLIGVNI